MTPSNTNVDLTSLLKRRQVLIVLGSGGVGKTTISASLALRAALLGRTSTVCTIDPAKRLADALSIELTGAESTVPNLPESAAPMTASMLDSKATFDTIIRDYARSQEHAEAILNNSMYQRLSSQTAGVQEFMASEKLHQLYTQNSDQLPNRLPNKLIVLDTPPARHAVEFLTAPERMLQLLNHSSIKWIVSPPKQGFSITRTLTRGLLKQLSKAVDKVFGLQILRELQEFFQAFDGMYDGFAERANFVQQLIRSDKTGIIIVTSPQSQALLEAEQLADELEKLDLNLDGIIFNKVLTDFQTAPTDLDLDSPNTPEAVRYWSAMAQAEKARAFRYLQRFNGDYQSYQIGHLSELLTQPDNSSETKIHSLAAVTEAMASLDSPTAADE